MHPSTDRSAALALSSLLSPPRNATKECRNSVHYNAQKPNKYCDDCEINEAERHHHDPNRMHRVRHRALRTMCSIGPLSNTCVRPSHPRNPIQQTHKPQHNRSQGAMCVFTCRRRRGCHGPWGTAPVSGPGGHHHPGHPGQHPVPCNGKVIMCWLDTSWGIVSVSARCSPKGAFTADGTGQDSSSDARSSQRALR